MRVSAGKGNEIHVEAIKRVRHRDADEGRRLLNALRIELTQVGNRVEVRTIYPSTRGRSMSASVDYTITVPQNASINVKTISGDVGVTGVRGEVRVDATSGDVERQRDTEPCARQDHLRRRDRPRHQRDRHAHARHGERIGHRQRAQRPGARGRAP